MTSQRIARSHAAVRVPVRGVANRPAAAVVRGWRGPTQPVMLIWAAHGGQKIKNCPRCPNRFAAQPCPMRHDAK